MITCQAVLILTLTHAHICLTYLGSHLAYRPFSIQQCTSAPCGTAEISSPLIQKPPQTESADTHDQIIALASQHFCFPCAQENEQLSELQTQDGGWGGHNGHRLPEAEVVGKPLATHFSYTGWTEESIAMQTSQLTHLGLELSCSWCTFG